MRTFQDTSGTKWTVDLNVAAMRRVKALLEIDLTLPQSPDPVHGTLSQRLFVDVWTLVDVLCAICRPQAEQLGIKDEEFAERLGGDVLGIARTVLLEEWSDFFRSLGRADLEAAVAKTRAVLDAVGKEAVVQMNLLETELLIQAKETMQMGGRKALASVKSQMNFASGE